MWSVKKQHCLGDFEGHYNSAVLSEITVLFQVNHNITATLDFMSFYAFCCIEPDATAASYLVTLECSTFIYSTCLSLSQIRTTIPQTRYQIA